MPISLLEDRAAVGNHQRGGDDRKPSRSSPPRHSAVKSRAWSAMCDVRNSDPVDHSQLPSDRRYSVEYNLIFYCIEIVCEPLLIVPPFRNYAIMRGTTALGYLFAYIVYRRMRTQLARVIAGTKADDTYPRSISRA